ncbi:uncharacterized protein LOC108670779 [Hyalella azteca]|uniref:Uncharacterized protein LOC108670779 n=1 Tax=Hyalella azteca TaxID=294128 RepID=A0A8B7NJE0_HYAAZ|nr:uncharacterized protein LOC108670779 [Hyalella azteca]
MALCSQNSALAVSSQEFDYGSTNGPSVGADSLMLRAPMTTRKMHPVESSERTYQERQEKLELQMATRTFGLGFAMHRRHERAAAGFAGIGHLNGVLPRSNAMHDALTARDVEIDFSDTLALDVFSQRSPHELMERALTGKF